MASIPASFPPGTTFFDVNGVPVTRAPNGGLSAWDDNPRTGETAPRTFGLSTWTSEGVPMSEADWRAAFTRSNTSSAASE